MDGTGSYKTKQTTNVINVKEDFARPEFGCTLFRLTYTTNETQESNASHKHTTFARHHGIKHPRFAISLSISHLEFIFECMSG